MRAKVKGKPYAPFARVEVGTIAADVGLEDGSHLRFSIRGMECEASGTNSIAQHTMAALFKMLTGRPLGGGL